MQVGVGSFLVFRCFSQGGVGTGFGEKLGMGSLFDDASVLQNQNTIGVFDGGKPMGDHQHGPLTANGGQGGLKRGFVFWFWSTDASSNREPMSETVTDLNIPPATSTITEGAWWSKWAIGTMPRCKPTA